MVQDIELTEYDCVAERNALMALYERMTSVTLLHSQICECFDGRSRPSGPSCNLEAV